MANMEKYTVITGASSGIGYAAALTFAGRGKNIIAVARRKERLEELQREIHAASPGVDVIVKVCDLSVTANVYQLYEALAPYPVETWINNAGFGNYSSVAGQAPRKIEAMLRLNIEALAILSSLYVRDYQDVEGTQLINLSSRGGYVIVPNAVTYCATKFFVGAFTEGLAHELKAAGAKLQAKVLAPAATETEFGKTANDVSEYDYAARFGTYHTCAQMAGFLLQLYDSEQTVGLVNGETFEFRLQGPRFEYAGTSAHNQK